MPFLQSRLMLTSIDPTLTHTCYEISKGNLASLTYEQVMPFAECFLSPLLCSFRNGYNTQHAFIQFLETCMTTLDSGDFAGA